MWQMLARVLIQSFATTLSEDLVKHLAVEALCHADSRCPGKADELKAKADDAIAAQKKLRDL